jgi:uncharacterized membrane protein
MFTITGTVFSITVVALSLTSQQFGPRLLRTFMLDKITQLTLGTFIATAVYSLLVLRIIEDGNFGTSVPHISVTFAIFLAILSFIVLIVFIHHLAMLIQAPHVVRAVSKDLDAALVRLFPEKLGNKYKKDEDDKMSMEEVVQNLGDAFQKLKFLEAVTFKASIRTRFSQLLKKMIWQFTCSIDRETLLLAALFLHTFGALAIAKRPRKRLTNA